MSNIRKDSTGAIKVICAIVFCLFSFLYIYCYQTPTLSYAQHVLSGGQTFYHPLISAIIICVVCFIIQGITHRTTRLNGASYALTYLPSMLLLAFLTCPYHSEDGKLALGSWVWTLPVIIIVYILSIKVIKQWINNSHIHESLFSSKKLMLNTATMLILMLFVVFVGNGNGMFQRQVWAEKMFIEKRYDELAKEGQRTNQLYRQTKLNVFKCDRGIHDSTDSTLTLLRFIAMDKLGILADSLFTQPVVGGTASLLRLENVHPHLFSKKFLSRKKGTDYRLCALLVEGDLDNFVLMLNKKCNINDSTACDSLPKHYREALVLYQHLRSNPITSYSDPVLETDFADMHNLKNSCKNVKEQELKLWQNYRNTYWFYYIRKNKEFKANKS